MKKTLLTFLLISISQHLYADEIIFEKPNGEPYRVVQENDNFLKRGSNYTLPNNNNQTYTLPDSDRQYTLPEGNKTNPEDDPDVLFVQKETPVIPQVDTWTSLIQNNKKNFNSIEERLKNGQNVNQAVLEGNTMLMLGAMQNNFTQVKLALKYKANTQIQNKQGDTALHWAAGTGGFKITEAIINSSKPDENTKIANKNNFNAYINKKDRSSKTPLHFAALYQSNVESINLLLDNNADINSLDINGQTPAHFAAAVRNWDNLETLLKRGANLSIKDKNEMSVEDIFFEHSDVPAMIKLYPYLSSAGKTIIRNKIGSIYRFDEQNRIKTEENQTSSIAVVPPLVISQKR